MEYIFSFWALILLGYIFCLLYEKVRSIKQQCKTLILDIKQKKYELKRMEIKKEEFLKKIVSFISKIHNELKRFVRHNWVYVLSYIVFSSLFWVKSIENILGEILLSFYNKLAIVSFLYLITVWSIDLMKIDKNKRINLIFALIAFIIVVGQIWLLFLLIVTRNPNFETVVIAILFFIVPFISVIKSILDLSSKRSWMPFIVVLIFIFFSEVYILFLLGIYNLQMDGYGQQIINCAPFESIIRTIQYGAYVVFQSPLVDLNPSQIPPVDIMKVRIDKVYQFFIGFFLNVVFIGMTVSYTIAIFFESDKIKK